MSQESSESVAKVVQERLNKKSPGQAVRVIAGGVRRGAPDDGWWYVPVEYQQDPYRAYQFYELFAAIEETLKEEDGIDVLIVPRILAPPPDIDVA